MHNAGIDIRKDYNTKEGALKVFQKMEKDIIDRCDLYRSFFGTITHDLQSILDDIKLTETTIKELTKQRDEIKEQFDYVRRRLKDIELAENTIKDLTKELDFLKKENDFLKKENDFLKKENEYLRWKLNNKFQAELQDKIEQILLAGKGIVEIPISGQIVRFVYVCPGKYYIGSDEELNKKLAELRGHTMNKFRMYEITLKSGFFIMEDKITPEQLQAISNKKFQVPNGLTWKQAMESAEKANMSLSLILNGMTVRLPSEIEWECAVRGKESKTLFPWGNENPDKNPDEDNTQLGIKHAASIFAEWCIDKETDNYGFDGTVDAKKAVIYFPNNNAPYFTYYCVGDSKEHKTIIDHELKSSGWTSFHMYKGASDEDLNKKNYHNRAISMRRAISDDFNNPNISFRFVLIPDSMASSVSSFNKSDVAAVTDYSHSYEQKITSDFVFVIDTTSGVEDLIKVFNTVVKKVQDEKLNVRLGLVEYQGKSNGFDFDVKYTCPLTDNMARFSRIAEELKCGNDKVLTFNSEVFYGLKMAIDESKWSDDENKQIILLSASSNKDIIFKEPNTSDCDIKTEEQMKQYLYKTNTNLFVVHNNYTTQTKQPDSLRNFKVVFSEAVKELEAMGIDKSDIVSLENEDYIEYAADKVLEYIKGNISNKSATTFLAPGTPVKATVNGETFTSNVSELVLDSDRPAGYSIMGGQNNLSLDSGWQDNWQRYLLWKKISPGEVDQYTMPGVRLVFTVE